MTTPRDQFIEQMGLMTQAEGMPRIAGQILGYLIIEGEPRTLTQMTEALKISKGSASTNARLLEHKGTVRRVSALGQRQDAYEAVDEPGLSTLAGMAERFRANAAAMEAIGASFSDQEAGARKRVERVAEFHRESAVFLDEWMTRMSAHCAADDTKKEE
jgi:DNA-binding MarR family transcriptional regulator